MKFQYPATEIDVPLPEEADEWDILEIRRVVEGKYAAVLKNKISKQINLYTVEAHGLYHDFKCAEDQTFSFQTTRAVEKQLKTWLDAGHQPFVTVHFHDPMKQRVHFKEASGRIQAVREQESIYGNRWMEALVSFDIRGKDVDNQTTLVEVTDWFQLHDLILNYVWFKPEEK